MKSSCLKKQAKVPWGERGLVGALVLVGEKGQFISFIETGPALFSSVLTGPRNVRNRLILRNISILQNILASLNITTYTEFSSKLNFHFFGNIYVYNMECCRIIASSTFTWVVTNNVTTADIVAWQSERWQLVVKDIGQLSNMCSLPPPCLPLCPTIVLRIVIKQERQTLL